MNISFHDNVEKTSEAVHRLHATRVLPEMIEHVAVDAYGGSMTLAQVASVSTSDARQLIVSPWDKQLAGAIEKGLHAANLGAGIVNDGTAIRVTFPPLTEERRKQLVKDLHACIEEGRIKIRRTREEYLKQIKDLGSEDEQEREKQHLQKAVDEANAELAKLSDMKEKELLTI